MPSSTFVRQGISQLAFTLGKRKNSLKDSMSRNDIYLWYELFSKQVEANLANKLSASRSEVYRT